MYDYVLDTIRALCPSPTSVNCKELDTEFVFYVPDGTYLVSNTLIYSGEKFTTNNDIERLQRIRIIGQSRAGTVIKLKDNSPGYEAGAEKPVVAFGKGDFNNTATKNTLRNLTVDTGNGNPGAIGVYMGGANNCSSYNLRIASGDGSGSVGIDFGIGTVVGYHRDITIEGFDYGMRLAPYHFTDPVLEHVTIKNQNVAGILFVDGAGTIRKLRSENSVPTIQCVAPGNHAVILDSEFSGGAASNAAIDLQQGHVFARNITTSGYGAAVKKAGAVVVPDSYVSEYVSDAIAQWSDDSPTVSMNLPIEDSPEYWSSDLDDWALVDDYPSIQDAFNSGKPVIVFSKREYDISTAINIPPSVKRVVGMYTNINTSQGGFIISEDSSDPVIIDDLQVTKGTAITQACPRTIVMNNIGTQQILYGSSTSSGKLFINACNGLKYRGPIKNVTAFIRFVNTESTGTQFLVDNSNVVVMGYKTEKTYTSFEVINSSRLEILGGLSNQNRNGDSANPAIDIYNSEASLVFATSEPPGLEGLVYENPIRDTQGDTTRTWARADFPDRGGSNIVVPLYVNHLGPYGDSLPPTTYCIAPDELTALANSTDAQLSLNVRNETVSSYEVRYREPGAEEWLIAQGNGSVTALISNLSSSSRYEWQVRVQCAKNLSDWSSTATFATGLGAQQTTTTLAIDGVLDEPAWDVNVNVAKLIRGSSENTVTFGTLWDETYLYVGVEVLDSVLIRDSGNTFVRDDGITVYLDVNNNGGEYDSADNRFVKNYNNDLLYIAFPFEGNALHD